MANPKDLALPPHIAKEAATREAAAAEQAAAEAVARGQRPSQRTILGPLIVGNGCYVNPMQVAKYEVATTGKSFGVFAWLTTDDGRGPTLLSPLLGTEEAAQAWLDKLCVGAFAAFRVDDTDKFIGVDWDAHKASGVRNAL